MHRVDRASGITLGDLSADLVDQLDEKGQRPQLPGIHRVGWRPTAADDLKAKPLGAAVFLISLGLGVRLVLVSVGVL